MPNDLLITQMGTIIADSSHFTAFHRNIPQCQATVILTGFPSPIFTFRLLCRKCCPDPSSRCVTTRIPDGPLSFLQNCFPGSFGGRSALLILVRVASLLPSDDKTVPAFTFTCLQEVFSNRSYLIIFPPLGSTFQRTLCSGWRLSVSPGFTLGIPAPALPAARLSPVRSVRHPS